MCGFHLEAIAKKCQQAYYDNRDKESSTACDYKV